MTKNTINKILCEVSSKLTKKYGPDWALELRSDGSGWLVDSKKNESLAAFRDFGDLIDNILFTKLKDINF